MGRLAILPARSALVPDPAPLGLVVIERASADPGQEAWPRPLFRVVAQQGLRVTGRTADGLPWDALGARLRTATPEEVEAFENAERRARMATPGTRGLVPIEKGNRR